jgi:hypothetical protein
MTVREVAAALILLGAWNCFPARGAERAEDVDKFARWAAPEKDPILCRLKVTAKQKRKLLDLHASYAKQKAAVIEKYKDVRMAMARRGMYREIMQLEAGAETEFPKVLTADQRRRMKAGEAVIANCRTRVEKIQAELDKRAAWARSNPSGYAEFKKRCGTAIKNWEADRDRKLDQYVGKKPKAGSAGEQPEKIDLDEAGAYKSGKWEYRLKVEKKAGKVTYRSGSLTRDGKGLHLEKPGTVLKTPWGRMKKLPGKADQTGDQGWIPIK